MRTKALFLSALAIVISACGSSSDGGDGTGDDQNATATSFPAFKADIAKGMPKLTLGNGGPVLRNAKIVTITFESDDPSNVQTIESFTDQLAHGKYWSDTTSEYGVGPFTSNPSLHVHIPASDMPRFTNGNTKDSDGNFSTQKALLDTDLVSHLFKHANDPSSGWPAPDSNTVYAVYVPKSIPLVTRISDTPGQLDRMGACDSFEGFHDERVRRGSDGHFLYTIIDEACGEGTIQETTDTASHELAESVTDPFASTDDTAALNGFDLVAWSIFQDRQEEIGDACEFYPDANVAPTKDFPFKVQALWSNKSAAAGHNPCIPDANGPYYNVIPLNMQDIDVVIPPKRTTTTHTRGFKIAENQKTGNFSLGLYSDADTHGEWTVSAYVGGTAENVVVDGTPDPSKERRLTVAFGNGQSTAKGKNGDKVDVTITVDRDAQAEHGTVNKGNGVVVTFISEKKGMPKRYMPVMVTF
jgi:hypothetical protein